jgi:diguanylate cyclase (GGDEF)-like protein
MDKVELIRYWEKQPKLLLIGVGILLVLLIGIIDYLTGIYISLAIFYLIPIIFITWLVSRWSGLFISLLSTVVWFIADTALENSPYALIPYWNAAVRFSFFVIIAYLLSALKIAYEREKRLARTDMLTGAINRYYFMELLQAEINRNRRYGHPLTVAYIDVDNFKMVNDSFGHSTGDKLLHLIANTIKRQIRTTDVIARLGGDEFALLLLESSYESARIVLHRVHKQLMQTTQTQSWAVSFSIGAVTFIRVPDSVDVNTVVEQADELMYAVKHSGKNRLEHKLFDASPGNSINKAAEFRDQKS